MKGIEAALTSCVSGHVFAGNVVMSCQKGGSPFGIDSLGRKGMWYGRVEPKHVEGIISSTLLGRRVIEELLRGVFRAERNGSQAQN